MVREPAKRQLANDGAGEGDVADILLRGGVLVQVAVLQAKNGGDGADDLYRLKAASVSKKPSIDPRHSRSLAGCRPSNGSQVKRIGPRRWERSRC